MGTIMKNNINYSGGGGSGASAAAVSYNNTASGLTSGNAQGAIDELAEGLASKADASALDGKADRLTYNESSSTLLLQSGGVTLSSVHIEGGSIATIVHVQTHEQSWWNNPAVTIDVKDSDEDINNGHFDANGDYIVKVHHIGTYTVTVTDDQGNKYVTTFEDNQLGAILYVFIEPYGWKGWLNAASMATTAYPSLEDVLADEKALRELFTKHASVDYLVAWLGNTSADEVAHQILDCDLCAKWINLRDYALDMLYANAVIKAVMDEVDKYGYGEWALIPQVPKMTSDTAPYGEIIHSETSNRDPYRVFNYQGKDDYPYSWGTNSAEAYIGYKFSKPVAITRVSIAPLYEDNISKWFDVKVQASNDGNTWIDLCSFQTDTGANGNHYHEVYETVVDFNNNNKYLYYRVTGEREDGGVNKYIVKLQFYAWGAKGNIPIMTSNTAPYGTASASSTASGYEAYKAFNNDYSTLWASSTSDITNARLQYKFTNPICVKGVKIKTVYSGSLRLKTFSILGSNNGTDWETLREVETLQNTNEEQYERTFTNDKYYTYIALGNLTTYQTDVEVRELQFYGRELNVSVPVMTSNISPWGEAFASSEYDSMYPAWKAFNPTLTGNYVEWAIKNGAVAPYIYYKFEKPIKILAFAQKSINSNYSYTFKIGYSDDGIDWVMLDELYTASDVLNVYQLNDNGEHLYWKLQIVSTAGTCNTETINFYGVDYSEREFEEGSTMRYIYDHGVELEELDYTVLVRSSSSGYIEKEENAIHFNKSDGGTGIACFMVNNKTTDLAQNSLIRLTANYSDSFEIVIFSTKPTVWGDTNKNQIGYCKNTTPTYAYLDVSNINAEGYLMIGVNSEIANTVYADICELWLE